MQTYVGKQRARVAAQKATSSTPSSSTALALVSSDDAAADADALVRELRALHALVRTAVADEVPSSTFSSSSSTSLTAHCVSVAAARSKGMWWASEHPARAIVADTASTSASSNLSNSHAVATSASATAVTPATATAVACLPHDTILARKIGDAALGAWQVWRASVRRTAASVSTAPVTCNASTSSPVTDAAATASLAPLALLPAPALWSGDADRCAALLEARARVWHGLQQERQASAVKVRVRLVSPWRPSSRHFLLCWFDDAMSHPVFSPSI